MLLSLFRTNEVKFITSAIRNMHSRESFKFACGFGDVRKKLKISFHTMEKFAKKKKKKKRRVSAED